MSDIKFQVGGKYNWRNQPERLSYMGIKRYPGDSREWHQFEKVDAPGKVWSEVLDSELSMFEETASPTPATSGTPSQPAGVSGLLPANDENDIFRMARDAALKDDSFASTMEHLIAADYFKEGWETYAALAARESVSEPVEQPVATIRTWHINGEQHADAWEWLDALDSLPDGVHPVYTHPVKPGGDAVREALTDEQITEIASGYADGIANSGSSDWSFAFNACAFGLSRRAALRIGGQGGSQPTRGPQQFNQTKEPE